MVPFENDFAKLKFGTELHIEVHNGCVLARICGCCADKDIQDGVRQPFWIKLWRSAAILNNCFIHKIFIFHETEMKFGENLPIKVMDDSVFANFSNYFEE